MSVTEQPPHVLQRSRASVARPALVIGADLIIAFALWALAREGAWFLFGTIAVVAAGVTVVFLNRQLVPLRWLAPGLALLLIMSIAPILYTGYISISNYSAKHLLTKEQALQSLDRDTVLAPGDSALKWTAFAADGGDAYALWLEGADGATVWVTDTGDERRVAEDEFGPTDDAGVPLSVPGYTRITPEGAVARLTGLAAAQFGDATSPYRIESLASAGRYVPRYTYDPSTDSVTDTTDGTVYTAQQGSFVATDGRELTPSYQAFVGLDNFVRLLGNEQIREPAIRIFIWTVIYALLSVVVQFICGLIIALALNDPALPRRLSKLLRSILLLPYVIPAFLTILVWGAMLNPNLGIITRFTSLLGIDPSWVDSPDGAKLAVLIVTFWLGTPYFMLILSGALQSIPKELVEAAQVDGASAVTRFRFVVVPILLRMVSPLVLLAFAFNFTNFTVVYLLKSGGPPMADSVTPAGHTDVLVSYTYKLAFSFGQGADYALAAVVTLLIFSILVPLVVSQFRYYAVWSEED